jgi:pimeloyl-ACP methyl ester carboxylesterase
MKVSPRRKKLVLTGVMVAGILGTTIGAGAQSFEDLQKAKSPLVLDAWGSFFVGGQTIEQTAVELGLAGTGSTVNGHRAVNQMYVQYMVPKGGNKVPVVMVHGGGLSGKGWETQPDGRMGWAEYFVRKGHAVYIPDQVGRARSGFNQGVYNNVRAGITPPGMQPNMFQSSNENAWAVFRFGPTFGVPYPDEQFPVESIDDFAKQVIPDLSGTVPSPNPNYQALSDLAIMLKGAVVIGHSQSGRFPLDAALVNPTGTKGLIAIEPVGCNATVYTDQQIATLATVPILVMFGDHLDTPSFLNWTSIFANCQAFIARVNAAGGNAQMLWPPDLGIHGNSHMIMNDKNSDQIADLILNWINANVGKKKAKN